jgi:hypothetical protein
MPWISLAATRYRFKADMAYYYGKSDHEKVETQPIDARAGLESLLSGEYVDRELKRAVGLLKRSGAERKIMRDALDSVLSLACLAWMAGHDIDPVLDQIRKGKAFRSPLEKKLKLMAEWITDPTAAPQPKSPRGEHVQDEKEFLRVLERLAPEEALDIALTPDHGAWTTFSSFILPLAVVVTKRRGAEPDTVRRLLYLGPHPERRGHVLFEATQAPPKFRVAVRADDRSTWPSFAAVEIKGETLFAYHYMGISWKAPLLFEPDLNAFDFLDHLELSWKLVEEAVPAKDWKQIQQLRKAGHSQHVVAFDSTEAAAPEGDLDAAAQHYGLALEAHDLLAI